MPSETLMVPNWSGYPPPPWTPSFAAWARRSSERLHGVISFHELAMPICGFSQSASPMPTARSMPRDVVASMPSVTVRERGLISGALAEVSGMLRV
jgi:cytochrome b561